MSSETLQVNDDEQSAPREPSRREVWRMFDRIAHRYDLANRLLSFGIDRRWRRRLASHLPTGTHLRVLDLATGTADQILDLFARSDRLADGVGMDLAEQMLVRGRQKVEARGLSDRVRLETGDACAIPSEPGAFDALTMSFGIRNVVDVPLAFREMLRVLRPGGRALILEFSLPANGLIRRLHLFYLRHLLPRVGGFLSGDVAAYRYLNQTIETFPYGQSFCDWMEQAGFENARAVPLTFGIATLYIADRPNCESVDEERSAHVDGA